jgi:hypothetical protein
MTVEEKADLLALRGDMQDGFREIRELIEARRKDDADAHNAMEGRLRGVERIAAIGGTLGTIGLMLAATLVSKVVT